MYVPLLKKILSKIKGEVVVKLYVRQSTLLPPSAPRVGGILGAAA